MIEEPLILNRYENVKDGKKRISLLQFLATFALGAVLALSLSPSESQSSEATSFWLNQAKAEYIWN